MREIVKHPGGIAPIFKRVALGGSSIDSKASAVMH
jgi:hypothetical protein